MEEITMETILGIHSRVLARDGGDPRIVSEGNIHQMVFQANLKSDPVTRAASVFWSLCAYPAFREGNRRTAYLLAELILSMEGSQVSLPCDEISALAQGIDMFTVEIEDVEQVLQLHAKKTH